MNGPGSHSIYDEYAQLLILNCGVSAAFIVLRDGGYFHCLAQAGHAAESSMLFPSRAPASHPLLAHLVALASTAASSCALDKDKIFQDYTRTGSMSRFRFYCGIALTDSTRRQIGALLGLSETERPDGLSAIEQASLTSIGRLLSHCLATSSPAARQETIDRSDGQSDELINVFSTAPFGLLIVEAPSGRVLLANKKAKAIPGLAEACASPDPASAFGNLLRCAVLYGVGCINRWVELPLPDGHASSFLVSITIVRDESLGTHRAFVVLDQHAAPKAPLQPSDHSILLRRHILEMATQAIWLTDINGRITYLNQFWQDFTGISLTSTNRKMAFDLLPLWEMALHPGHRHRVLEHRKEAFQTGKQYDIETLIRRADGQYRWFLIRGIPIHFKNGRQFWIGIATDIHDRVKASRQLLAMLEAMPQMIWSARPDGYNDFFNQRWEQFSGKPAHVLEGDGWAQLLHPDDREPTLEKWRSSLATGDPFEQEYRLRRLDGQWLWILAQSRAVRDDQTGEIIRWYGSCTEIEASIQAREILKRDAADLEILVRKRTQALELALQENIATYEQLHQAQKMEAVGQLTGGIAHDFNNILTSIIGNLELLQDQQQRNHNAGSERFIRSALNAADKATALIDRLLAFSRRQPSHPSPTDINAIITGLEDLLNRTLGTAVHIEVDLDPALWQTLCDPHQFESTLLNLAINAKDAMLDGGVLQIATSNISIEPASLQNFASLAPGDYVSLSVKDDGCGMSPDTQKHAFEPFFTTKPLVGTGLGLSMVYGFVKQSKGYIEMDSAIGQGTTITIYLPRLMQKA